MKEGARMREIERLQWALVHMEGRKAKVEALFEHYSQFAHYEPQNPETKYYRLWIGDLEAFESYYNAVQDLNEKYGDRAIYHLGEISPGCDLENRFREILGIWTDTKLN